MIEEKYPKITLVPCVTYTLNLLLKAIGKLGFVPKMIEANHIVKFIRKHQLTYVLFHTKSAC